MSCLRPSRENPSSITKKAESSRTWCRCHYCRRKIHAGKSRMTIWALKFLTKLGLAREVHGGCTQRQYKEDEYYSMPNGLTVLCKNEGQMTRKTCMGEDRNPGGEDDKRVTSKASSSSSSSSMSLRLHGVDPMFDNFIEKNRERFRLEKDNSFERRNYYTMWPYLTYYDPSF